MTDEDCCVICSLPRRLHTAHGDCAGLYPSAVKGARPGNDTWPLDPKFWGRPPSRWAKLWLRLTGR